MTAVRLRGQDAINRALTARNLHLNDGWTLQEIATHYEASHEAVRQWMQLARKHTLPDIDNKQEWLEKIITNVGARLEDAKDVDAVKIADSLSKLLGIGSAHELKQQQLALETAKAVMVAEAFDRVITGLPDADRLRAEFVTTVKQLETTDSP